MVRPRSLFAGDTDYTGVPLADIIAHLEGWRAALREDIAVSNNIRQRLLLNAQSPAVRDGEEFADYFVDLFERFAGDFDRLLGELPRGVRQRHVEIVAQMYRAARDADTFCVRFKQRHNLDALSPNDPVQNILAEFYRLNRDAVINMFDLSNVISRLKTYVEEGSARVEASLTVPGVEAPSALNALELKPNFFGLGMNLNYLIDRWLRWWRRR